METIDHTHRSNGDSNASDKLHFHHRRHQKTTMLRSWVSPAVPMAFPSESSSSVPSLTILLKKALVWLSFRRNRSCSKNRTVENLGGLLTLQSQSRVL